jgi:hypothetical protein
MGVADYIGSPGWLSRTAPCIWTSTHDGSLAWKTYKGMANAALPCLTTSHVACSAAAAQNAKLVPFPLVRAGTDRLRRATLGYQIGALVALGRVSRFRGAISVERSLSACLPV